MLLSLLVYGEDLNPLPSKEMVTEYNELRQDIVLLYELKLALANCQYELQTLRHRYETLATDRVCLAFYIVLSLSFLLFTSFASLLYSVYSQPARDRVIMNILAWIWMFI